MLSFFRISSMTANQSTKEIEPPSPSVHGPGIIYPDLTELP